LAPPTHVYGVPGLLQLLFFVRHAFFKTVCLGQKMTIFVNVLVTLVNIGRSFSGWGPLPGLEGAPWNMYRKNELGSGGPLPGPQGV